MVDETGSGSYPESGLNINRVKSSSFSTTVLVVF
jgi:hypothetical protein